MEKTTAPQAAELSAPLRSGRWLRRHLPALLALLVLGGLYALLAEPQLGPRGLILILLAVLIVLLLAAFRGGRLWLGRTLGLAILGLVTAAEAISTSVLVLEVLTATQRTNTMPQELALGLLRDAALIWLVNILTFSFWYWEIDAGGPAQRHLHGYHSTDFVFPQLTLDQANGPPWTPHYVDYLFLAFTMSTAFSPTDTLVLSVRAKLLVMTQAIISLVVLAIIAARAINTL